MYGVMAKNYHWTQRDIDETDFDFLMDLLAANYEDNKPEESKIVFADEVDWGVG